MKLKFSDPRYPAEQKRLKTFFKQRQRGNPVGGTPLDEDYLPVLEDPDTAEKTTRTRYRTQPSGEGPGYYSSYPLPVGDFGGQYGRPTQWTSPSTRLFTEGKMARKKTAQDVPVPEVATGDELGGWDEEEITKALMQHFGPEFEDEIRDSLDLSSGRYSSFGEAGSVTVDGVEYNIIGSEEEAENIAREIVTNDLNDQPELFTQDWLQQFVSISPTDRSIIAGEEATAELEGLGDDEIRERYEAQVVDSDSEADIDTMQEELESVLSDEIEEQLEDPIQYFVNDRGIYTVEDLMKADFITIDVAAAAEDALGTDGWAHFISLYSGDYETIPGGYVIFRE